MRVLPAQGASPIKRGLIIGAITGAVAGIGAMQTADVGCDTPLGCRTTASPERVSRRILDQ